MAPLQITINISPALADLASREAWRAKMHWNAWVQRWVQETVDRAAAEQSELVCWPTARERRERVSYL